jgi:hypothetical protein
LLAADVSGSGGRPRQIARGHVLRLSRSARGSCPPPVARRRRRPRPRARARTSTSPCSCSHPSPAPPARLGRITSSALSPDPRLPTVFDQGPRRSGLNAPLRPLPSPPLAAPSSSQTDRPAAMNSLNSLIPFTTSGSLVDCVDSESRRLVDSTGATRLRASPSEGARR